MSTKSGCLEHLIAGCFAGGVVWSILLPSFLPLILGLGAALGLAALADVAAHADRRRKTGRTGRRLASMPAGSAELLRKNAGGLWVAALGAVYRVPFARYPFLAALGSTDLCEVELREGRYLYWPRTQRVVPLHALAVVTEPLPPTADDDDRSSRG